MEGGVPEIVIHVVSADARFRDAQFAHAPADVKLKAVVPRFRELNGMLRRVGRHGNGGREVRPTAGELRLWGMEANPQPPCRRKHTADDPLPSRRCVHESWIAGIAWPGK